MTICVMFGIFLALSFETFLLTHRSAMLQLTKAGEYAVRAMLHLAALPSAETALIAAISHTWDVPETFLRKIVGKLTRGGLLKTTRGNGGGIALARPACEITLLDVIQVAEGPLSLNACLTSPDVCHRIPWCPVHSVWCEAQQQLRTVLSSRTLEDLARQLPSPCQQPARPTVGLITDQLEL